MIWSFIWQGLCMVSKCSQTNFTTWSKETRWWVVSTVDLRLFKTSLWDITFKGKTSSKRLQAWNSISRCSSCQSLLGLDFIFLLGFDLNAYVLMSILKGVEATSIKSFWISILAVKSYRRTKREATKYSVHKNLFKDQLTLTQLSKLSLLISM